MSDARSGSRFERVIIDGQQHFLKVLGYRTDWIMRVTGDRDQRTFRTWQAGLLHQFPVEINHTVVAMARDGAGLDTEVGILMRDVGDRLIPPGGDRSRLTRTPGSSTIFGPDTIAGELAAAGNGRGHRTGRGHTGMAVSQRQAGLG